MKLLSYIKYLLTAKHKRGFGVHSPFLFELLNNVIYETKPYYCFEELKNERKAIKQDSTTFFINDFGTGVNRQENVRSVLKNASSSRKDAELLFRIAVHINAKCILELGTNLGITSAYLAKTSTKTKVFTFEGAEELAAYAETLYNKLRLSNVEIIRGDITKTLPEVLERIDAIDMAYLDANHTYEATISYFTKIKAKATDSAIIILGDIHWSRDMERAWNEIKKMSDVRVTLDMYRLGIVILNPSLTKQDYIVSY